MKKFTLLIPFLFLFFSCTKNNLQDDFRLNKPTLKEFIKSLPTEEARVLDDLNIIDLNKFANVKSTEETSKIKIKFTWDCDYQPIGLCIIIPIGKKNYSDDELFVTADISIINDSIIELSNIPSKEGVTEDNYFPLDRDYTVDQNISQALGYKEIIFKKGIYKAFYDTQSNTTKILLNAKLIK